MASLPKMNNIRFKNKYRIPSTRMRTWDYSSSGWYYVTICTKNRICYFGEIKNRKMKLSIVGKQAKNYWIEITDHFKNVTLDEYNVLPNHVHGIIIITNIRRDVINHVSTNKKKSPMGSKSLGEMIRWFKGRTTFEARKNFPNFSWQSRFYDHIIRDQQSLNKIRWYIRNNHLKWDEDEENPRNH